MSRWDLVLRSMSALEEFPDRRIVEQVRIEMVMRSLTSCDCGTEKG